MNFPSRDTFNGFLLKQNQVLENVQCCVPVTKVKQEFIIKQKSFVLQNNPLWPL